MGGGGWGGGMGGGGKGRRRGFGLACGREGERERYYGGLGFAWFRCLGFGFCGPVGGDGGGAHTGVCQ